MGAPCLPLLLLASFKQASSIMSLSPPPYVLIGSQHSLFTGKLRAYLQWRNLPFLELTASGELYRQVILPRTGL